jgi:hypothetical protein
MEQKTKQNNAAKEQLLTPIMEGKFQFACQWLKFFLFGEPTLEVKDEIIRTKKEKIVTR